MSVVVPAAVAVVVNQLITSHSIDIIPAHTRESVVSVLPRSILPVTVIPEELIFSLSVPETVADRLVQFQPNQVVDAVLCGINDGAVADEAPD